MKPRASHVAILVAVTITITGCAGVTPSETLEEQLLASGFRQLNSHEIETMLNNKTLHGKFGTSKATVFLESDGSIHGKTLSSSGSVSRDRGTWKVSSDGLFCDTWNSWQAGTDCDKVFVRGDEFVLLNLDGTKSSEGQIENGNSRGL